ncbi:conserved hypothetical protein [Talaromyces stipitatus ATCC 10500]|uniref:Uncharacterized protein n=1 Tax=Talaromyces stipitatus (strain ATCC 10500 / CBS 375.48 / QM 6759 / NRRL 1006) TaxID=441959 RepID=B8MP93_TALSN|nr:uncharacterized protein TSTA_105430 [Talaromyces stipitatus ATCC 10500]EED14332.1 conserved hypothetical protein [Talaromyces stipitatus ATCC 10500]
MASDRLVFVPPLNKRIVVPLHTTSLTIYCLCPDVTTLRAQVDDSKQKLDLDFTESKIKTISSTSIEVAIFADGATKHGNLNILSSIKDRGTDENFITEISLSEDEELKSQRVAWLNVDDWEGWAWYRPRDTWIEVRYTSLVKLDSQTPSHSLLLRPTNPAIDPGAILAVFPASTAEAFVTLSAARDGEVPGVYARVRRVQKGGKIEVCITGKLHINQGTRNVMRDAIHLARIKYGLPADASFIEEKTGETPFDRLGFCTWSSIGENIPLTYDLMDDLLTKLNRDNVQVGTFLIDDGWQDIRYGHNGSPKHRGLWSFRTWQGMKSSLADNVSLIKKKLPMVKDVGVWMTLAGYWNSVSPYSPLARKYNMRMYPIDRSNVLGIEWPDEADDQQTGTIPDPELRAYFLPPPHRAFDFWRDYFQTQADVGVTFVKVDNQAYGSYLEGVEGGEEFVALWNNMIKAANQIFGKNRVIHCMAHYERFFNGDIGMGVATNGEKVIIRNTDDFGLSRPNIHRNHIHYNLYNGVLLSNQCLYLDTDMFMTSAQWPEYHAVLRAFFDGPIFLADKPGVGDFSVHKKLTARCPGDLVPNRVVRAKNIICPLSRNVWEDTLGPGRGPPIKASSYDSESRAASIVLWNGRSDAVDNSIDIIFEGDILDVLRDNIFHGTWEGVIWACNAATAIPVEISNHPASLSVHDILASTPVLATSIKPKGYEILTVAPYNVLGTAKVAVIGLVDKYAALAGIQSITVQESSLVVETKYDGILGFIVKRLGAGGFTSRIDGESTETQINSVSDGLQLVQVDFTQAPSRPSQKTWSVTLSLS